MFIVFQTYGSTKMIDFFFFRFYTHLVHEVRASMKRIYHIKIYIGPFRQSIGSIGWMVIVFNASLLFYYIIWRRNGQQNKFNQEYNMIKAQGNFKEVCLLHFNALCMYYDREGHTDLRNAKITTYAYFDMWRKKNDSHILSKNGTKFMGRNVCFFISWRRTNESEWYKEWLSVYYELISFAVYLLCCQPYTNQMI